MGDMERQKSSVSIYKIIHSWMSRVIWCIYKINLNVIDPHRYLLCHHRETCQKRRAFPSKFLPNDLLFDPQMCSDSVSLCSSSSGSAGWMWPTLLVVRWVAGCVAAPPCLQSQGSLLWRCPFLFSAYLFHFYTPSPSPHFISFPPHSLLSFLLKITQW